MHLFVVFPGHGSFNVGDVHLRFVLIRTGHLIGPTDGVHWYKNVYNGHLESTSDTPTNQPTNQPNKPTTLLCN
jgi:hypothetical protein